MRGGEKGKGVRLEEALGSDAGILSLFIYLFSVLILIHKFQIEI
jgi:hypothetical protein